MKERLQSLDIFRGLTIAAMILVNNPGSWDDVYAPLLHSEWNGCSPADLIFPFFIFIAGVSIPLARQAREAKGATKGALRRHILRRVVILLMLGLLVTWFTGSDWQGGFADHLKTWRLPGVLQRIALVYGVSACLDLDAKPWQRAATGIVLLTGYWAAMTLAPLTVPSGTVSALVDRSLFGDHLWYLADPPRSWDPEGFLSSVPAIVTGLLGVAAGRWLQRPVPLPRRLAGLAAAGAGLVALGYGWDPLFPINKALWTSSFVVFTAGWAALVLAILAWVADMRGWTAWAVPFRVFGTNAILAYAGDEILGSVLYKIWPAPAASFYQALLLLPVAPKTASLLFALSVALLWGGILTLFYRRRIFLKV